MKYEKTITFTGEATAAIEIAKNTFLPNGFKILDESPVSISMQNSSPIWLKGQTPLAGVSDISIQIASSELIVKAKLGGLKNVMVLLGAILLITAVILIIVFSIVFKGNKDGVNVHLITMLSLSPWPILLPLMYIFMKNMTSKALEALIHNMITQPAS